MAIRSTTAADWWKATARIYLGSEKGKNAGILMAPDPGPDANRIAFCGKQFWFGRSDRAIQSDPSRNCSPGCSWTTSASACAWNRLLFTGTAGLDVVKIARAGTMVVAIASPAQTFTLSANDAGQELRPLVGRTFRSTSVMAGGSYALQAPGTDVTIPFLQTDTWPGNYPGRVMVGGGAQMNLVWIR